MEFEEILRRILSARRELTRDQLLKMVEERKREARGFLTDEAAARIIASELGVELAREPLRPEIPIQSLVSGLGDVTVTGRIVQVHPTRRFARPDGTVGRVASLVLADRSGRVRVVLWDDKAELAEGLRPGQILRISHGYVREGRDGEPELHVGGRGEVQPSPPDAAEGDYPPIEEFMEQIGRVSLKLGWVNVEGRVRDIHPITEFRRENGTPGRVMRMRLSDDTGEVTVVFWDEKVDEVRGVRRGDRLQILGARVRERFDGTPELHVEGRAEVRVLPKPAEAALPTQLVKIADLKPNMRDVRLIARVAQVGSVREFDRGGGRRGRVSTILLMDETGDVRLNLWGEMAPLAQNVQQGDILLVEGAYTRERFGRVTLNLDRGTVTLNPKVKEAEGIPPYREREIKIAEIMKLGEGELVTVEGTITASPAVREVTTSRGERVRVAQVELEDETGRVNVSLWRGLAEAVDGLEAGSRVRIRGAYVRRGFSGELELTSGALTTIEVLGGPAEAWEERG